MSVDTNIPNLVINKLTKQQYEGLTPAAGELYFIVDQDEYLPANQGSGNAGKVLTIANDGSVTNSSLKTVNNTKRVDRGGAYSPVYNTIVVGTDAPRAFEVFSKMALSHAELAKNLMDLHEQKQILQS